MANRSSGTDLRRAITEKVFCTKHPSNLFRDARLTSATGAASLGTAVRKGEVRVYTAAAAINKVYLAKNNTTSGTAGWIDLTP